jgi:hypothetical protein
MGENWDGDVIPPDISLVSPTARRRRRISEVCATACRAGLQPGYL